MGLNEPGQDQPGLSQATPTTRVAAGAATKLHIAIVRVHHRTFCPDYPHSAGQVDETMGQIYILPMQLEEETGGGDQSQTLSKCSLRIDSRLAVQRIGID